MRFATAVEYIYRSIYLYLYIAMCIYLPLKEIHREQELLTSWKGAQLSELHFFKENNFSDYHLVVSCMTLMSFWSSWCVFPPLLVHTLLFSCIIHGNLFPVCYPVSQPVFVPPGLGYTGSKCQQENLCLVQCLFKNVAVVFLFGFFFYLW